MDAQLTTLYRQESDASDCAPFVKLRKWTAGDSKKEYVLEWGVYGGWDREGIRREEYVHGYKLLPPPMTDWLAIRLAIAKYDELEASGPDAKYDA